VDDSQPVPTGVGWPDEDETAESGLGWPDVQQDSAGATPAGPARQSSTAVSRETVATVAGDPPIAHEVEMAVRRRREREALHPFPSPAETRLITVANQKGGVGKTTTTVNVAAALAQGGLRVLVVDLDPQGNASTALSVDHRAGVPSMYDVLVDDVPMRDVIVPVAQVSGLWCAPATIDLAGAEIELVPRVAREMRLARALQQFLDTDGLEGLDGRLDYVLIDCPPSLGLLTINALAAAHEVLIPIQCEYYALEGLTQLLSNIELVRAQLNPQVQVSAILLTMYDGRTRLAAGVAEEVRAHFPDLVLDTVIPRAVRVSEAPSYGQTVITFDPASPGALSYVDAARELAARAPTAPASASAAADALAPTPHHRPAHDPQPVKEVRP
jgi:chromosome partitioning protein